MHVRFNDTRHSWIWNGNSKINLKLARDASENTIFNGSFKAYAQDYCKTVESKNMKIFMIGSFFI